MGEEGCVVRLKGAAAVGEGEAKKKEVPKNAS